MPGEQETRYRPGICDIAWFPIAAELMPAWHRRTYGGMARDLLTALGRIGRKFTDEVAEDC